MLTEILHKVENNLRINGYKGYDPYDFQLFEISRKIKNPQILFLLTQLNKYSTINFRQHLKYKAEFVPKGLALILLGYLNLLNHNNTKYIAEAVHLLKQLLIELKINNYSGACWGLKYGYQNRHSNTPPDTPSSVVTNFVQKALLQYYNMFPNDELRKIILSCGDFVLNDLNVSTNHSGCCYSYTPLLKDRVFNANGHSAEILSRNYWLTGDLVYKEKAKEALNYIVSYQKKKGEWVYGLSEDNKEDKQIDFHQGFILLSFVEVMKNIHLSNNILFVESLKKGLDFYRNKLFHQNGQPKGRYPHNYPIDIHSSGTGILCIHEVNKFLGTYDDFHNKILDWTINNMFNSKTGEFYFKKYYCFTNKVNYHRWGQAWMFYALTSVIMKTD